jgi:beta-glucosidase
LNSIDIKQLLSEMTLEEKAGLCSGANFWYTKPIERLGLPSVMVSDGPHGLRKQESPPEQLGLGETVRAVCFPAASALACSFDKELLNRLGSALGDTCQAEQVSTILGPGVNMKRSPLCGRNFEYFSEDPFLAGELAASYVKGVQSKNVGTSVKHFAVNNQETRRMSISAEVDERTLREIYLAAFETIVKKAQPWTMMCSYNCINGTYSCENDWLLNQVLRKEWGFKGLVMTDWGAMNNRVEALKAGLDLEMPSSKGITDKEIVEAVQNGALSMEVLDTAAGRVIELVKKYEDCKKEAATYHLEEHHTLSRQISNECAVLLRNEDQILPLNKEAKIAFIGQFAENPRFQGGGSSHINCFKISNAVEASKEYKVNYAKGFDTSKEETEEEIFKEAVALAKESEVAVVFAGLPDHYESEGYDRTHLNLPMCQNTLIEEIIKVQPNTVVVLHNGSPISLPWADKVKGILEVYLGGQAVGESTVDLLFGEVNPSGKLAETFPMRVQDNPSYLNFPGTKRQVEYKEGVLIGYRYYDARNMAVLFPFGFGLSYTTFEYSNLELKVISDQHHNQDTDGSLWMKDTDRLLVSLKVKNTGNRFGKEIIQLYVHDREASVIRAPKELKGFEKLALAPGEEKTVCFTLDKRSFAYYSTELKDWYAETGEYDILIGKSSHEIVLTGTVTLESTLKLPFIMDDRTTFADIMEQLKDPSRLLATLMEPFGNMAGVDSNAGEDRMLMEMMKGIPLHALRSFAPNVMMEDDIKNMVEGLMKE